MKKIVALALGAVLASVSMPAVALDVPTSPSYLSITPCFENCLYGAFIDASDATTTDSFQINDVPDAPFYSPSITAEYNPETGIAFFVTENGELFKFDVINEDGLEKIADNSSLPTVDGEIVGLAIDDATDVLYALYNDPDAGSYFVVSVDQSTGVIGTPLEMPFVLTMVGAFDFAIAGDKMYVLSGVEQIKVFNMSDGTLSGSIAYPMDENEFFFGYAIDISSGGVLRVASSNIDTGDDEFFSYDLGAGTWSAPLLTDGSEYDGIAWYGAGDFTPALAETGFDPSGLALTAVALAGAGAVALRRRARR